MNFSVLVLFLLFFVSCKTTSKGPIYKIRIESGDTLSGIADKYGTSVQSIVDLNDLDSATEIHNGQIIYLKPGRVSHVTTQKKSKSTVSDPSRRGLFFGGSSGSVVWPVKGSISSEFGLRNGRPHDGIDIRAPYGTSIKAVSDGKVKSAGWISGYGRVVVISHSGYETLYAHCSKIKVKKGQTIRAGQIVGLVGTSGRPTGPHLHFEYRTAQW